MESTVPNQSTSKQDTLEAQILKQILIYGMCLQAIWGPSFHVEHRAAGDELLYRWAIRTVAEPKKHVRAVKLTTKDRLIMMQKGDEEKCVWLFGRFSALAAYDQANELRLTDRAM